jgi:hypothetical protein
MTLEVVKLGPELGATDGDHTSQSKGKNGLGLVPTGQKAAMGTHELHQAHY